MYELDETGEIFDNHWSIRLRMAMRYERAAIGVFTALLLCLLGLAYVAYFNV